MKILLLGKNGQVGWELQRSLAPWVNCSRWTGTAPRTVVT
jgi:dTDP-4-dehydrorhamnose reductase